MHIGIGKKGEKEKEGKNEIEKESDKEKRVSGRTESVI